MRFHRIMEVCGRNTRRKTKGGNTVRFHFRNMRDISVEESNTKLLTLCMSTVTCDLLEWVLVSPLSLGLMRRTSHVQVLLDAHACLLHQLEHHFLRRFPIHTLLVNLFRDANECVFDHRHDVPLTLFASRHLFIKQCLNLRTHGVGMEHTYTHIHSRRSGRYSADQGDVCDVHFTETN